jgi:hypothetical protein
VSDNNGPSLIAVKSGGQLWSGTVAVAGGYGVGNWTGGGVGNWTAVAISANGTTQVAAQSGSYVSVATPTSSFGHNPSAPVGNWTSVAISADGLKIVAVEGSGRIWTTFVSTTIVMGSAPSVLQLLYVGSGRWTVVDQSGSLSL